MDTVIFLKGILIGIAISAPVGPIGVLCIKRTFSNGRASGFATGLGAATADGLYGAIAAYGLTYISDLFTQHLNCLRLAGGLILLYLGIKTFLARSITDIDPYDKKTLGSDYVTTFFLTLTNPITIAAFVAIFAAAGLPEKGHTFLPATIMVTGVLLGSCLWWFSLSSGINILKKQFRMNSLHVINKISGTLLVLFAAALFLSLL